MKESIGITLKLLRKEKGLTLRQLAELSGVVYSYISEIESGRKNPSTEIVERILLPMDVPFWQFACKAYWEKDIDIKYRMSMKELQDDLSNIDAHIRAKLSCLVSF